LTIRIDAVDLKNWLRDIETIAAAVGKSLLTVRRWRRRHVAKGGGRAAEGRNPPLGVKPLTPEKISQVVDIFAMGFDCQSDCRCRFRHLRRHDAKRARQRSELLAPEFDPLPPSEPGVVALVGERVVAEHVRMNSPTSVTLADTTRALENPKRQGRSPTRSPPRFDPPSQRPWRRGRDV
jgi:hypothetical protein